MAEVYDITLEVQRVLTEELTEGRKRIIANSKRARQEASGKTYRGMKIAVLADAEGARGIMSARPYFAALETGSRPWRGKYKRPPMFFVDIMEEWIADKGLKLNPYAVATSVMRKGSRLYRQGGRRDIFTPVVEEIGENVQTRTAGIFQAVIAESVLKYTKPTETI